MLRGSMDEIPNGDVSLHLLELGSDVVVIPMFRSSMHTTKSSRALIKIRLTISDYSRRRPGPQGDGKERHGGGPEGRVSGVDPFHEFSLDAVSQMVLMSPSSSLPRPAAV